MTRPMGIFLSPPWTSGVSPHLSGRTVLSTGMLGNHDVTSMKVWRDSKDGGSLSFMIGIRDRDIGDSIFGWVAVVMLAFVHVSYSTSSG